MRDRVIQRILDLAAQQQREQERCLRLFGGAAPQVAVPENVALLDDQCLLALVEELAAARAFPSGAARC